MHNDRAEFISLIAELLQRYGSSLDPSHTYCELMRALRLAKEDRLAVALPTHSEGFGTIHKLLPLAKRRQNFIRRFLDGEEAALWNELLEGVPAETREFLQSDAADFQHLVRDFFLFTPLGAESRIKGDIERICYMLFGFWPGRDTHRDIDAIISLKKGSLPSP